jgi:hypothetical protein
MIGHTIRQTIRPWQWLAALVLLTWAVPAMAAVQEMRVIGVGSDTSSMQAAEKAMDYAKKRAVYLATLKLGVPNAGKVASKFTDEQLGLIVRGATVTQTRREGYITYADVNVTIVDEALRRALKLPDDYGKARTQGMDTRGLLLLPVYAGKERAYLWEKENLLRAPLAEEVRRQSYGSVLLPGGDLDDLRLIDYNNALTVGAEELTPMFKRYGADEIVIAVLTIGAAGTSDASTVLLRRITPTKNRNEVMEIPLSGSDETSSTRLGKAAAAIAAAATQIATSTAERDQAARAAAKTIPVTFAYAIPKELARMQEAVRAAPQVLYLDVPSIALAQVTGTIYLKGEAAPLRELLTKQGVVIAPSGEGWRLSVR